MTVAETFSAAIDAVKHPTPQLEMWREYEGAKVSNCGRVISQWGHELKPKDNGNGYLFVTLKGGGKWRNLYLHKIVAGLFVTNPMPLFYDQVNHIYGLRHWNRADCLEHCDCSHNLRDKYAQRKRLGLPKFTQREQARINAAINAAAEANKKRICYSGNLYSSVRACAEAFGVSKQTISYALRKGAFRGLPIRFAS